MLSPPSAKLILAKIWGVLPNTLVLGVLGSIGLWGHVNHWQIPKFSELGKRNRHETSTATVHETKAAIPAKGGEPKLKLKSPETNRKLGIETASAQQRTLDEYINANGVITYDQTHLARLSPRAPGIVWRVEKHLGQLVHKGEVLAIIDSSEVGKAKAEFLQALVAADHKAETLARLKSVGAAVPERQLLEAEAALRDARFRRFNTQQALVNLGLTAQVGELAGLSDDELARRIHFLGLPLAILSTLAPEITTANLIPLVAPFDGVVVGREAVVGEMVEASVPQFVVADVSRMWILLEVRKEDAGRLAIGQQMLFSTVGLQDEVESKVTWISTEVDEKTRTVQVRAEVLNPQVREGATGYDGQRLLRANSFGSGRLRVRDVPLAVVVPSNAVQWDDDGHLVFVPRADGVSFEPRKVRPGVTREGVTEIQAGLAVGEVVVTKGSHLLKSERSRLRLAENSQAGAGNDLQ